MGWIGNIGSQYPALGMRCEGAVIVSLLLAESVDIGLALLGLGGDPAHCWLRVVHGHSLHGQRLRRVRVQALV